MRRTSKRDPDATRTSKMPPGWPRSGHLGGDAPALCHRWPSARGATARGPAALLSGSGRPACIASRNSGKMPPSHSRPSRRRSWAGQVERYGRPGWRGPLPLRRGPSWPQAACAARETRGRQRETAASQPILASCGPSGDVTSTAWRRPWPVSIPRSRRSAPRVKPRVAGGRPSLVWPAPRPR